MGNFYVSFTAKSENRRQIADTLRVGSRKAIVGPTVEGWTAFFDEEADEQDPLVAQSVAELVSREAGCLVLAVLNHDDDLLAYWLAVEGELRDEYNSVPDFPEGELPPAGGDAFELCAACGVPKLTPQVEKVLRRTDYVFAVERHQDLATLLGQSWPYPCGGYRYVSGGELPAGLPEEYEHLA